MPSRLASARRPSRIARCRGIGRGILAGARNSHIATLVERHSRYVHLVKVKGKDTESVVDALLREVQRLPTGLMESLTWDRGTELAQHQLFSVVSDVAVYFCDPHSPWQRGSNENTNGLLRQYFPQLLVALPHWTGVSIVAGGADKGRLKVEGRGFCGGVSPVQHSRWRQRRQTVQRTSRRRYALGDPEDRFTLGINEIAR